MTAEGALAGGYTHPTTLIELKHSSVGGVDFMKCSEGGCDFRGILYETNYCPVCGRKVVQ